MNNDYGSKLGGGKGGINPISMVGVRGVTLRLALSARKRDTSTSAQCKEA